MDLEIKSSTLKNSSSIIQMYADTKNKSRATRQLGQIKRRLKERLNNEIYLNHKREINQALKIVKAHEKLLRRRFLRMK